MECIHRLRREHTLPDDQMASLLECDAPEVAEELARQAREVRDQVFGPVVYVRGLMEFTSYCKNDCLYCGLRRGNRLAQRYRLTDEELLACAQQGHRLGFRTFVLQGGEDPGFSDERLAALVEQLKARFPDCAVTLSVGERPRQVYQRFYDAGADRYLLRHETADPAHYRLLHPPELHLENRMRCLEDLKDIGFQVGCGGMVGSPGQRTEHLLADLAFLRRFQPHMVGIGPFIPHRDTPFGGEPAGSAALTLRLLSIVRLMLPRVLLPATTALGTLARDGRLLGLQAGANVLMPNLSPPEVRGKYLLYDNKLATGLESAEALDELRRAVATVGCQIAVSRGDSPDALPHPPKPATDTPTH